MSDFTALVNQTSVDSGALTGVSAVAHKFDQSGAFTINILKDNTPLKALAFAINPVAALGAAVVDSAIDAGMAHLDLAHLGTTAPTTVVQVAAGDYTVFHAASGETGHAVMVQPQAAGAPSGAVPDTFDSRQLGAGDIFSTVLLRPGSYKLTNALGNGSATLTVAYPVIVPGTPYRPPEPVSIACNADGFAPATAALKPAQGLIITINTKARIKIDLVTPDDGPAAKK